MTIPLEMNGSVEEVMGNPKPGLRTHCSWFFVVCCDTILVNILTVCARRDVVGLRLERQLEMPPIYFPMDSPFWKGGGMTNTRMMLKTRINMVIGRVFRCY